MNKNGDNLK